MEPDVGVTLDWPARRHHLAVLWTDVGAEDVESLVVEQPERMLEIGLISEYRQTAATAGAELASPLF